MSQFFANFATVVNKETGERNALTSLMFNEPLVYKVINAYRLHAPIRNIAKESGLSQDTIIAILKKHYVWKGRVCV